MRTYQVIFCGLLCLAAPLLLAQPSSAPPELLPADVRLMIDVSGSMKRTDPNNLRKPAMELLVRLLPDESRAGVWTFGTRVNRLMHHQPVNQDWRVQALAQSNRITASDLHTHIGAALNAAAFDQEVSISGRRNIIFLTDGLVDIAKDTTENMAEREQIERELLPRLKAAGYTIHTIALSAEADHDLMEKLAKATDGVYASVMNADELMGVFLRIFDQAVPQVRLPLNRNRFWVDESVDEFTALVFRKKSAAPTELQSPGGNRYAASNSGEGISWYKSDYYDLITVSHPHAGEWLLNAEQDPDNRVTVVSDLTLVVTPPGNNIEVSQPLNLHFLLQEAGKTLNDPQFLQVLNLDVTVIRPKDGRQWQMPIPNTVPPIDGIYYQPLELFRETGEYQVKLLVDGKTFKREYSHHVIVGSPFTVDMQRLLHNNRVAYRLRVSADDERVDLPKTAIVASIRDSTGGSALREFEFIAGEGYWELLVIPEVAARYSLGLQVSGQRKDGSPVKETLASRFFVYPDSEDPLPDSVQVEVAPLPDLPAEEPDEPVEDEEQPAEAVTASSSNPHKLWLYTSLLLANLVVFALAFFAYRMIMGKKAKDEAAEIEATLNTDVHNIVAAKEPPPPMQEVKSTSAVDLAEDDAANQIKLDSNQYASVAEEGGTETEMSELDAFLADADFNETGKPEDTDKS